MHRVLAVMMVCAIAACGSRSGLREPLVEADASMPLDALVNDALDASIARSCAPNCTVGHHCCRGSCFGQQVALPTACCACIAGEVNSNTCGNNRCGF